MKPIRNQGCETVRPLLFASLEGEVGADERDAITAHLAWCEDCGGEMLAERSLTDLLGFPRRGGGVRPARRSRRSRLRIAAATSVLATGLVFLGVTLFHNPAYGSIEPRTLAPSLAWRDDASEPLGSSNHIELPSKGAVTLRVRGVGVVSAVGPAAFELDGSPEGWKLVLLRGRVSAELEPGGRLFVVSALGTRDLLAGEHLVTLEPGFFAPETAPAAADSPAAVFQRGLDAYYAGQDPVRAEHEFRAVLADPRADAELRNQAGFYLGGALHNQERYAEALEVNEEWLRLHPGDDKEDYVLFFQGTMHQRLGHAGEALAIWEDLLRRDLEPELLESVQRWSGMQERAGAAPPAPTESGRREQGSRELEVSAAPEAPARKGGETSYLVVRVALDAEDPAHAGFLQAAERAASFHDARVGEFDGEDFDALAALLLEARPANALFVIPPERLDVMLHRKVLLLSAELDEDPFADLAFGYLTARDGEAVLALWERTLELHDRGLSSRRWMGGSVVTGMKSTRYSGWIPDVAKAAGFTGDGLAWSCIEDDPEVKGFVRAHLPELEQAGVIDLSGNGDPQGIWLFSDQRNVQDAKHWDYAPDKVGHDPAGEMPRIHASQVAGLELKRPVVWNGACHSAATRRVFVEGDIVSTFGRTEVATVHELAPGNSFCLAVLDAGAAAYLAPIAANHGYAVLLETRFALVNGATLGETIKSTWDDVFLQAGGPPRLDLPQEGETHPHWSESEDPMQGGGVNRILIGDPALAPFEATPHTLERVEVRQAAKLAEPTKNGFEVVVTWKEGFHPGDWDMFGTDREADGRMGARVDLDGLAPEGRALTVTAEVTDGKGRVLPYELTRAATERFAGRRFLHLQVNASRPEVKDAGDRVAVFRVAIR